MKHTKKSRVNISQLPDRWLDQFTDEEIASEEAYHLLDDPTCESWVGLKALYSLANKELFYKLGTEAGGIPIEYEDPPPNVDVSSLKDRLLGLALTRSHLLTYHEVRVLNLLLDNSRANVAEELGIKKARLSQIIRRIREKLL